VDSLDVAIVNEAIRAGVHTSPATRAALNEWYAVLKEVMQEEIDSFVRNEQQVARVKARQDYQRASAILAKWKSTCRKHLQDMS
jgi:hypothetical protein